MNQPNSLLSFLLQPFFLGLYLGIIGCVFIYLRMLLTNRSLNREIKKLKQHLHTKLEIDAEANEERKDKIDALKQENENLRITVQTLGTKPGRKEIRQFYIYQKALDSMTETAPGFAPAWQNALRDAQEYINKIDKGFIPFIKRITGGGLIDAPREPLSDKTEE